jgi:hypothetical protein
MNVGQYIVRYFSIRPLIIENRSSFVFIIILNYETEMMSTRIKLL